MDIVLTARYLDDLAGLGVTIPDQAVNARGIYDAALAAAALAPSDDLKAELEAGAVTPETVGALVRQAALDLAAQQNAHQIVRDLQLTLHREMRKGLRDNAPRIVTELRAAFKPAAQQITDAAKHFGPGANADEIINAAPAVVAAWKAVTASSHTLDVVSGAYRRLLNDVLTELPAGEQMVSLFVTGKAVDMDHAAELYHDRDKWLALARAGFTLRLNSPTEAASVRAGAQAVRDKQAAAEREQRIKANRFAHRFDLAR